MFKLVAKFLANSLPTTQFRRKGPQWTIFSDCWAGHVGQLGRHGPWRILWAPTIFTDKKEWEETRKENNAKAQQQCKQTFYPATVDLWLSSHPCILLFCHQFHNPAVSIKYTWKVCLNGFPFWPLRCSCLRNVRKSVAINNVIDYKHSRSPWGTSLLLFVNEIH